VELTATNFRKHLFQVLERAAGGEAIDITWKGSRLRLSRPQGGSRLGRAVRRHALLVPPGSIVESDAELMAELETQWRRDDEAL
jgi:hypothetical protein